MRLALPVMAETNRPPGANVNTIAVRTAKVFLTDLFRIQNLQNEMPATTGCGITFTRAAPYFLPVLARMTFRAFTLLLPFFARLPFTMTSSPSFIVSRCPSPALKSVRRSHFETPVGRFAGGRILHVDIEPDVRIGPFDLRHKATMVDRLFAVEFGRKRMVGQSRRNYCEHRESQAQQSNQCIVSL